MSKEIRVRKNSEQSSQNENVELGKIFDSPVIKIVLFAVSVFILFSVYNSVNITFQKLDILNKAEKEVENLRIENLYLSTSMKDMSTDKYLEKEARNRLNFSGANEIAFVIPDNVMEQAKIDVNRILESNEEEVLNGKFTLSSWVDFIMTGI